MCIFNCKVLTSIIEKARANITMETWGWYSGLPCDLDGEQYNLSRPHALSRQRSLHHMLIEAFQQFHLGRF